MSESKETPVGWLIATALLASTLTALAFSLWYHPSPSPTWSTDSDTSTPAQPASVERSTSPRALHDKRYFRELPNGRRLPRSGNLDDKIDAIRAERARSRALNPEQKRALELYDRKHPRSAEARPSTPAP